MFLTRAKKRAESAREGGLCTRGREDRGDPGRARGASMCPGNADRQQSDLRPGISRGIVRARHAGARLSPLDLLGAGIFGRASGAQPAIPCIWRRTFCVSVRVRLAADTGHATPVMTDPAADIRTTPGRGAAGPAASSCPQVARHRRTRPVCSRMTDHAMRSV